MPHNKPNEPVLKPSRLHRQRRRRRQTTTVLNQAELLDALGCQPSKLADALLQLDIAFHCDSTGQIFASVNAEQRARLLNSVSSRTSDTVRNGDAHRHPGESEEDDKQ